MTPALGTTSSYLPHFPCSRPLGTHLCLDFAGCRVTSSLHRTGSACVRTAPHHRWANLRGEPKGGFSPWALRLLQRPTEPKDLLAQWLHFSTGQKSLSASQLGEAQAGADHLPKETEPEDISGGLPSQARPPPAPLCGLRKAACLLSLQGGGSLQTQASLNSTGRASVEERGPLSRTEAG